MPSEIRPERSCKTTRVSMCSLAAMPASYDVLFAHPQPMFSHSPPISAGFLANCTTYLRYDPLPRSSSSKTITRRHTTPSSLCWQEKAVAAPRRPCLVIRSEESSPEDEVANSTRNKKKVVFADDRGMSLTQVRHMTEPSNVPPVWSMQFLAQVTHGVQAEVAPDPWEVTFPQPASDYLDFRQRLDSEKVSLENVIVKESQEKVVGTVKVQNLSFNKEVFIRFSADNWVTHEDSYCTYVNNNVSTAIALYDTFSFKIALPPRSRRIEFCVCFRCEGVEYWDSNHGKNYILVKKSSSNCNNNVTSHQHSPHDVKNFSYDAGKCTDAVYAKVESWSEFASWNHLVNEGPYW